jgi:hypothetical protein
VFSVTAALVIANDQQVPVIVPAVEVAAVLVAVALMRVLQVRAFTSIQLAPTLAVIAAEGRGILDDLYRQPFAAGPHPDGVLPPCTAPSPGRTSKPPCSRSTCPACSTRPAAP